MTISRLFAIVYALAGPTLAGTFIIVVLTLNMVDARSIIAAAAIGFVLALPVTWILAKRISLL